MQCKNVKLAELIRGDLSREESEKVLEHLERCSLCRQRACIMAVLSLELKPISKPRLSRSRRYLLVAATLALVGVLTIFFPAGEQAQKPSNPISQLATTAPYPYFPLETRSEAPERSTARQKAFEAYASSNFERAVELLLSLPEDSAVCFFRGVAAYMTGETSRALTDLTKAADRASTWSDPAIWFLANTYLLLEDKQQAAFTLQRLIEADSAFSKNAVALLQELEEQQKE